MTPSTWIVRIDSHTAQKWGVGPGGQGTRVTKRSASGQLSRHAQAAWR